jgi:alpha-ketoglutarate-dependent sulfate ester dioxygenase
MTTTLDNNTTAADESTGFGLRRLAGRLGAELTGIDAANSTEESVAFVRNALLKHRVVFLRDQHLDYDSEVAFAQRFGSLTLGHPTIPSPTGRPLLEEIDSKKGGPANKWHTDVTFVDRPPAFTFLHGVIIPPVGGDTVWANTVSAYAALPVELQELADRLRIVHTNAHDYAVPTSRAESDNPLLEASRKQFTSTVYKTEHPLVRIHPETGEKSLVLGGFAQTVVGLGPQASRDLIRILQDFVTPPENTVRWQWRVGDLAIWDNRATQHVAVYDYGDEHRRGERVTVAGPVPIGPDGRESRAIEGDASAYYATGATD